MTNHVSTKSRILRLLFFLSLSPFSFGQEFIPPAMPSDVIAKLQEYARYYYERRGVPGLSFALSKDGNTLLSEVKGFSDIENQIAVQPNSLFRIASISKLITSVAVVKLAQDGMVNLDEDIKKYLPYLTKLNGKVTLRNILSHTSGLRAYRGGEFNSTKKYWTTKELMDYLKDDTLEYKPGSKYLYSTLAYNYIVAVIETVTGKTFEQILKERVFIPAGMNNTFLDEQERIIPGRAKGYMRNDLRELQNAQLADLSIKYPGGGMLSTAGDLLKFGNGLLNGTLLTPAMIDTLTKQVKLTDGSSIQYGLGISIETDPKGRKIISHSGGGTGFVSLLQMYPSEKLVSVHLLNITDRNSGSPARDMARIFFGDTTIVPLKSAADTLMSVYLASGIHEALKTYKTIKTTPAMMFNPDPEEYKQFGYDLIKISKIPDAITIFNDMLRDDPQNKSAYIGLGDAYSKDNNTGLAIKSYRQALRLDPANKYVQSRLTALEKKK